MSIPEKKRTHRERAEHLDERIHAYHSKAFTRIVPDSDGGTYLHVFLSEEGCWSDARIDIVCDTDDVIVICFVIGTFVRAFTLDSDDADGKAIRIVKAVIEAFDVLIKNLPTPAPIESTDDAG